MESLEAKITEMKNRLDESKKLSEERRKIMQEENKILHDTMRAEIEIDKAEIKHINFMYQQSELRRHENAIIFCQGKTVDQLKEYLADKSVAYNSWKNLDLEGLCKLTLEVYDEEI